MNDKLKNVVVTIAFVFIIVIFFIANIIKKDDTISIAERRKLEQFLKFLPKQFLMVLSSINLINTPQTNLYKEKNLESLK